MATSNKNTPAKKPVEPLSFLTPEAKPSYVNNVRIKTTSDNVFIDFGFVDPFAPEGSQSTVVQRVVMNRTTFQVFSKHVAGVQGEVSKEPADLPVVIMSRCPSPREPG